MKNNILMFLILGVSINSWAITYKCSNSSENIQFSINKLSELKGEFTIMKPFFKKLNCDVTEYGVRGKIVTGFICDNEDSLPDIAAVDEKTLEGYLDLANLKHIEAQCVID